MRILPAAVLVLALVAFPTAQSPEKIDYAAIAQIRDEGLARSQVMDHIGWLADVYGPRLTGGQGILQASDWALKQFQAWGLANPHREHFAFGRGWSLVRFHAHMIEPQVQPLIGFPGAWTPSTNGTVTADVVRVQIDAEADFERYRGKLAGRIALTQPAREVRMLDGLIVSRMGEKELEEAATTPVPRGRGAGRGGRGGAGQGGQSLANRIQQFLKTEGVVAVFNRGSDALTASAGSDLTIQQQRTDGGTIFPSGGGSRTTDPAAGLPTVTLAVEHYNRMTRILDKGLPVKVELNLETKFHEEAPVAGAGASTSAGLGFNTIAEIPGTDPVLKDEVVLLGAHFDSVAASTGATDNATGSAAMMEAMRILQAVGVKPRRTIRIALWGAEEQGLLGSRAYVREHFADPATMQLKPAHGKISAYFNSDNGTGRIRGVWLQSNLAVRPVFERWIEPLKDLGVVALAPRSVASTDHVVVRRRRHPGVPVHGRPPRVQLAHPPLEHGHRGPRSARRHGAARNGDRGIRLQRRDARREAAAQGAAEAAGAGNAADRRHRTTRIKPGCHRPQALTRPLRRHVPLPPSYEQQEGHARRIELASDRTIRTRNKVSYRLAHWPIWIFVFFIAPGPLTADLFDHGFDRRMVLWLGAVLLGTGIAGLRGRLPGVEPAPYIIRFTEDRPNPFYRRLCYTLAWSEIIAFAVLNVAGLVYAVATGEWRLRWMYNVAYLPDRRLGMAARRARLAAEGQGLDARRRARAAVLLRVGLGGVPGAAGPVVPLAGAAADLHRRRRQAGDLPRHPGLRRQPRPPRPAPPHPSDSSG